MACRWGEEAITEIGGGEAWHADGRRRRLNQLFEKLIFYLRLFRNYVRNF
jgi:hypothetical protein